jgi:hypothetical protein
MGGFFGANARGLGGFIGGGGGASWTPESPTTDGGVSPHTWHYAGSDGLYQDSGKTTVADADGDPVGASVNQGSDSHDIVQTTDADRPTLKTSVLNEKPVFRFSSHYLVGSYSSSVSQPVTMFLVTKLDAAAVGDSSAYRPFTSEDGTNQHLFWKHTTKKWRMYAGNAIEGSASVDSDWHIFTLLFNGASSGMWIDGVSDISGNAGAEGSDGLSWGAFYNGGNAFDGDQAAILTYDSNLSTADRNQVQTYLSDEYGISVTDF